MIRFLGIENLAVIERLDMELEPGLNVITGETGAGKSILVEAVGLLVGGRASPDIVRTGADAARMQAIFETADGREVIVRREVSAHGRSRILVDDALTTVGALKQIAARFVELHGQHEHETLLDPARHLGLVDAFGGLKDLVQETGARFGRWRAAMGDLERVLCQVQATAATSERLRLQLEEIRRVGPRAGEDEDLATRRHVLASAERVRQLSEDSYTELYDADGSVLGRLRGIWRRVEELAAIDPRFAVRAEARASITSQLEDLALALRDCAASLDASPEQLQQVEVRLAQLERIKRKYGPSLDDVLSHEARLAADLDTLDAGAGRIAALEGAVAAARRDFLESAGRLTDGRREAVALMTAALQRLLADLALEQARCEFRLESLPEAAWMATGTDAGEFFLSANRGEELRPLARIASGGELSRIMLALRTLAAADAPSKTLVFDEVDAGIGGRVADIVGATLRRMGERFQVLCVSHLPQLAAHATTHYRISKSVRAGRTVTSVERLAEVDRVDEIARLIAGARVTVAVRQSAVDLLGRAKGEIKAKVEGERSRIRASV